jgi:Fur family ferric uptake transcriptional regulator
VVSRQEQAARLRRAGLRVTGGRVAVLAALSRADAGERHLDADAIAARARALRPGGRLSTQAVYDNLRVLTDAGLVRRIETAGSPAARYEARAGDNHHHLVCRRCGLTRDVDCVVGARPCLEPSSDHGFVVDEAEVTFWGLCPGCRATNGEIAADAGKEAKTE